LKVKTISIFLLLVFVLAACGSSVDDVISDEYPLKDTVKSSTDPDDAATVYIAKGKSIDQVAQALEDKMEPNRISNRQDNKQVLIYDDYFVTLTQSKDNPNNTDIEVASYTFVRDNYQPSFFNGLFSGLLLSRLFNVPDWGRRQAYRCQQSMNGCYGGYTRSGGHYKGPTTPPSFRGSLSGFRGGGPGAGK
jgi:hypothetical protein